MVPPGDGERDGAPSPPRRRALIRTDGRKAADIAGSLPSREDARSGQSCHTLGAYSPTAVLGIAGLVNGASVPTGNHERDG